MLLKTHLAITIFFILIFISSVNNKFVFILVALFATFIPDIDTRYSKLGKRKLARILQFFTKHRGMIHSFSFLISITIILVLFLPVVAFGFFLGYGLHLLADSFTITGIMPFYPSKKKALWKIKTGGRFESFIFLIFLVASIVLLIERIGFL